ncbi:MAG: crosslink repair DNA glycosylase YcaQ family protein [Marmoricola sp.]
MPNLQLSRAQARRIALVAQGFRDPRHTTPTMRTFSRTLARTGVLQIDSVNVLQRAHYMPLFSRMGSYDTDLLRRASDQNPRRVVEYWAHVAAYMPVDLWPYMHHRMAGYRERGHAWTQERASAKLVESLIAEIREEGAKTPRDLDEGLPRQKANWGWNWTETKRALEYLFIAGELAVSRRNSQFERVYDLPERVIPAAILDQPVPTRHETRVELIRRAARSHGVATHRCLRDYYRLQLERGEGSQSTMLAIDELVETGELIPASIQGWVRPAYLHRDALQPRKVDARALLSPFDPLVWERERTEHIFDFHYRIEIYVPEAKRQFGYYVLPFLLGDRIVARVDLKADRLAGVLRVQAAYAEPGAPAHTAQELAAELRDLADWLDLPGIVVHPKGDLAPELGSIVHS